MIDAIVRLARPEDEAGLMEHTRQLHQENGLFSFSDDKAKAHLRRAYDHQGGIIGVIGDVGSPEASIYLALDQIYYSDDWQLIELWNYVAPPRANRAGHAKRLLQFAKDCSTRMHLPLSVGIMSNHRVEAKVRLYERQLEKAGAFFVFNRQFAGGTAWTAEN